MNDWNFIYKTLLENQIPNAHATANTVFNEKLALEEILPLLKKRVPFEQILKKVEFYGANISINENVLIPRVETEILVDQISPFIENHPVKDLSILDLCTGSGCIAISLKKKFEKIKMKASDLSIQALEVANKNALLNGVSVEFRQGDLLFPWKGESFDIVIANPPYISQNEYDSLDESVRNYEPKIALTDGHDGYTFYRRLSRELKDFLKQDALVFFEIGSSQKEGVMHLFNEPFWKDVNCIKDFSGQNRFISARFKALRNLAS
jgi:release factor glutamine methyltransferase